MSKLYSGYDNQIGRKVSVSGDGHRTVIHQIKINVFRDGTEWFCARWIDGEYDGCDSLEISDDASEVEAIEAAHTMRLTVSGERVISRVDDINSAA